MTEQKRIISLFTELASMSGQADTELLAYWGESTRGGVAKMGKVNRHMHHNIK